MQVQQLKLSKMEIIKLEHAATTNEPLIWNDPDPIEGNDYNIYYIEVGVETSYITYV